MNTNLNNNNNSDSISQTIPNTTSSGSGDDHLLTAHADDEFNKTYHDNRAFQFYNNNSLGRKGEKGLLQTAVAKDEANRKNALDLDDLDMVIVHLKDDSDITKNICSCKHQILSKQLHNEPRKRHNATQTPTLLINCHSRMNELQKSSFCCEKHCPCLPAIKKRACCNCSKVQRCQHHCQHNVSTTTSRCWYSVTQTSLCSSLSSHQHVSLMPGSKKNAASLFKECEHWPLCVRDRSIKRHKRYSSRRQYKTHQYKSNCSSVGHLPNTVTKSSLDSSDDQNRKLPSPGVMQAIAIEIDAATMTEDNTTTATSNFAFKIAADSALAPIIRAPVHIDSDDGDRVRLRKYSSNSNTTIETDELSNDEIIDNGLNGPCCYHCCDHKHRDKSLTTRPIQNESVKIKRKRFITAEDYCSSCSRSSSCSCSHIHSSSCSSFGEWPLESQHSARSISRALTVSADCHHCQSKRQNSETSIDDLEGREDGNDIEAEEEVHNQRSVSNTTDSSARTSRRSSLTNSFCSCNSNTCCYCSGSREDSHTDHMSSARDATIASLTFSKLAPFDGEEGHSSTLTPLTNPSSVVSTPGDEGDVTIRSLSNNAFSECTSSQSHSAEYFSLSSANQISYGTPRNLPIYNKNSSTLTDPKTNNIGIANMVVNTSTNTVPNSSDDAIGQKERKPCKHYSKHHRHKMADSPVDSYL